MGDLAAYVRYPKAKVLAKRERDELHTTLDIPKDRSWTALVASVVLEDGTLRLFPLIDLHTHDYLETGPALLKDLTPKSGFDRLALERVMNFRPQVEGNRG